MVLLKRERRRGVDERRETEGGGGGDGEGKEGGRGKEEQ